jgi:hypothetical protein
MFKHFNHKLFAKIILYFNFFLMQKNGNVELKADFWRKKFGQKFFFLNPTKTRAVKFSHKQVSN